MLLATVANVEEAIELAEKLKEEGKFNWFRGQERAEWLPSSSLHRKLNEGLTIEELDKELFRFLDWACQIPELAYLDHSSNQHSLYAILQHYGYPTTYMDFTTEPSIAGFFASDTAVSPNEGTISAIFCLNTQDLVNFYAENQCLLKKISRGASLEVEPVTVDVSNLWRLQAQHGHFIHANHDWCKVYNMHRIEFPWTGLPAYPRREDIYPLHKSSLEHLIDEFKFIEKQRKGQQNMHALMEEMIKQGMKVEKIHHEGNSLRYEESFFSEAPVVLDSWKREELSAWFIMPEEPFHQVKGKIIDIVIRSISGAPAPHIQIRNAFRSALLKEPNLRGYAVNWKITGLEDQLDVELYLNAIISAWNGMRNLPYENDDIVTTMDVITQLFLINNSKTNFLHHIPNAYEIEFGNEKLNTVSRAYCSSSLLIQCINSQWKESCNYQEITSSPFDLLYACSKPNYMFDFEKFKRLFAHQIIPTQLVLRRPLVLFNPAKLDFLGNP